MEEHKTVSYEMYPAFDKIRPEGSGSASVPDWDGYICVDITVTNANGDTIEAVLSHDWLEDLRPSLPPYQYEKLKGILEHNDNLRPNL